MENMFEKLLLQKTLIILNKERNKIIWIYKISTVQIT